ncbi:unnamed protein product [Malus baccata var. baccata]
MTNAKGCVWFRGREYIPLTGCVWYVGRDGTERNEAFRPAFGALKMGGTGCSTGQILGVFAFHLPPETGLFHTNIPHVFFKNYTFVPSRPVPFRPVPSRPVPSRSVPSRPRTKRTRNDGMVHLFCKIIFLSF